MGNVYKKITFLILVNSIALSSFSQYNNAFRFKITGNGYSDETIIRLLNGASQNFDSNYDAWKLFSPNPNVPSIYTQISVGQELSINSLPEFSEDKSITIYTNIPVNGTYTINVEEIYALTSNYKISLTDISSNTHYRLLGDTALIFTFTTQQNSPSFTFNISTPLVTSVTDETCFNMNDGSVMINNSGNTDWEIEIVDASNNIIVNSNSNSSLNNYTNLLPGNYTAQVISKGIVDQFNFIVNPAVNLFASFSLDKDTIYLSEGAVVNTVNTSQNAQNYSWDFGDGGVSYDTNPSYTYTMVGDYSISLIATNANCNTQTVKQITVLSSPNVITSINSVEEKDDIKLLNLGNGIYQLATTSNSSKKILVYDIKGGLVYEDIFFNESYNLSLSNVVSGIYILNIIGNNGKVFREKLYK
jgi:PKD repeat protein